MNAASPESDPAERFLTDFEGVIRDLGERLRPRKWISEREQKSVSRAVKVIQDLETEILDRLKHQEKGSPEELFDLRRLGWLSRLSPEEIVREPAYLEQLRELIQAHAPDENFGSVAESFRVYREMLEEPAPEDSGTPEKRWEREDRIRIAGNRFRAVWEIRIAGVTRAIRVRVSAREQVIQDFLNDAGDTQFEEMYSGIRFSMENGIPSDVFTAIQDGDRDWRDRAARHFVSQFDIRKRDRSYVLSSYRELRTSKTGFGYLKYINEVQKNPELATLVDELGRSLSLDEVFREEQEELRQALKVSRGSRIRPKSDSINGIKRDNYIPYVLPEEFVRLADPDFEILFSKLYGGMTSYRCRGKELLAAAVKPNFWRAPTDNDKGNMMPFRCGQWKIASLYPDSRDYRDPAAAFRLENPVLKEEPDQVSVCYTYYLPTVPMHSVQLVYTVTSDGQVRVSLEYMPPEKAVFPEFPEFSVILKMDADFHQMEWYGRGPGDCYADRKKGCRLGIWKSEVSDTVARYLVPQESGNHTDVRWMKVTDDEGRGLLFSLPAREEGSSAENPDGMDVSVSPWSPHELEEAMHFMELPEIRYTYVRIGQQM